MPELHDIATNISDTYAAIQRLQDEMAQMDPVLPSIESTLLVLQRRREELETEYQEAAALFREQEEARESTPRGTTP